VEALPSGLDADGLKLVEVDLQAQDVEQSRETLWQAVVSSIFR